MFNDMRISADTMSDFKEFLDKSVLEVRYRMIKNI